MEEYWNLNQENSNADVVTGNTPHLANLFESHCYLIISAAVSTVTLDRLLLAKGPSIRYVTFRGGCVGGGWPGKRYVALHGGGVDNCIIPIGEVCVVL